MFLFFSKKRKENYVTACNFGRGDFLEKNLSNQNAIVVKGAQYGL